MIDHKASDLMIAELFGRHVKEKMEPEMTLCGSVFPGTAGVNGAERRPWALAKNWRHAG